MDKSILKTSPVIIKLRKSEEVSDNDVDLLLSLSKVTPVSFDLNPSTDNLSKMPLSGSSEKVETSTKERKTAAKNSRKKKSLDSKDISMYQVNAQRQSLTTDSSKLSDNKLDSLHGGDKSKRSKIKNPPPVMQPSNLPSDRLLDVRHGGGGIEPSVLLESSSSSVVKKSCSKGKSTKKKSDDCRVTKQSDKSLSGTNKRKRDQVSNKSNESLTKKTGIKDSSNLLSDDNVEKIQTVDSSKNKSMMELLNFENNKGISNLKSDELHLVDKSDLDNPVKTSGAAVQITYQRQSQTTHLSKLSDNKLDSLSSRDESKKSNVTSLVQQTSNLCSDQFSNILGTDTPAYMQISSPSIEKAPSFQENHEPSKKKIKLSDNEEEMKLGMLSLETTEVKSTVEISPKEIVVKDSCSMQSETKMLVDTDGKNMGSTKLKNPESNVIFKSLYPNTNELTDSVFEDESKGIETVSNNESKQQESLVNEITLVSNSLIDGAKSDSLNPPTVLQSFDQSPDSTSETQKSQCKLNLEKTNIQIKNEQVNINSDIKEKSKDNASDIQEFSEDQIAVKTEQLGDSHKRDSLNGVDEPVMEFDILDEFESNDNDPEEMNSDDDSEISANEIDAMLDEGLGNYGKQNGLSSDMQHEEREKVILKVRGKDHFEVLPEGWIEVTHNSGMPIYLHKQSRVCCVSKPYFLGPGSTRKHEIPISAIPCLHYFKQLEKEEEEKNSKEDRNETAEENVDDGDKILSSSTEENSKNDTVCNDKMDVSEGKSDVPSGKNENPVSTCPVTGSASAQDKGTNLILPSAKLESVKDIKMSGSLDYLAVREYCKKRFEFQTITVKRFKTWCGRRRHQKQLKRKQRPFLPDNTQLITCPLPSSADKSTTVGNTSKREFIMNPTGKSPVCILHEYVQHTLRVQPKYIFKELESASTPYGAVVLINDMEYGTGYGSSKKVAKSEAAKSALEVLIPKIKSFVPEKNSDEEELQDVEFFDQVRVEDPRVSELSVKAGQPYPYQILLECLKRNYGMGDTEVFIEMRNLKHQKNEFIMKVGKHFATVVCKNKRDGKHRASQSILQQLHPHINSWGSLLRMYGKGSCKTLKEKKEEEQRITELQSKACVNKPNVSILNKLKEEMLKYSEKMKSKKPIGKLIPERMKLFSISNSNLKSIEL